MLLINKISPTLAPSGNRAAKQTTIQQYRGTFAALARLMAVAFVLLAGQPVLAQTMHTLPFVTPASNTSQRTLVRIVNRSNRSGTVTIHAIDDTGERRGPAQLWIGARQTKHITSQQLEGGGGLSGGRGVGNGTGNWRLELETTLDIAPLAYIWGAAGFITTMHDTVRSEAMRHRVLTFNKAPASLTWSHALLRLINPTDDSVDVTITGQDDRGRPGAGAVSVSLPAGAARMLTVHQLEQGDDGFEGSLGDDGRGRWQLFVSADRPIRVMNLMRSPNTGYMTNLSSMKGDDVIQGYAPADPAAFDAVFVDRVMHVSDVDSVRFLAGNRFTWHVDEDGGFAVDGSYTYQRTSSDIGTLELNFDDEVNLDGPVISECRSTIIFLITATQAKRNLSSRSGIGGVLSAT